LEPLAGGLLSREQLSQLAETGPTVVAAEVRRRWTRTYGSQTSDLYAALAKHPQTAREVAPGVPEVELIHAVEREDACSPEDFLSRRTKLRLELGESASAAISDWFGRDAA